MDFKYIKEGMKVKIIQKVSCSRLNPGDIGIVSDIDYNYKMFRVNTDTIKWGNWCKEFNVAHWQCPRFKNP
jgi:hypothetical protein